MEQVFFDSFFRHDNVRLDPRFSMIPNSFSAAQMLPLVLPKVIPIVL